MNKPPKICLILPYFGKLPSFWGGYIDSCKDNADIDFLIVTDCDVVAPSPNVRVIKMSWEDMQRKVKEDFARIGLKKVCIDFPYKLCDYKPAYGYFFREYLKGYEWWGHMDCDLVFGDISKFLLRIGIQNYDRVYNVGHLSLYRNTPEITMFFAEDVSGIESIRKVVTSALPCHFDEVAINQMCVSRGLRFYDRCEGVTMSLFDLPYRWLNAGKPGQAELFVKEADGSTKIYREMPDGSITVREACYLHYMAKKSIAIPRDMHRPFCITHCGVFAMPDTSTDTVREMMNRYAKCSEEEQARFIKEQLKAIRKGTVKKIWRGLKYNGPRTLVELSGRVGDWLRHRRAYPKV